MGRQVIGGKFTGVFVNACQTAVHAYPEISLAVGNDRIGRIVSQSLFGSDLLKL